MESSWAQPVAAAMLAETTPEKSWVGAETLRTHRGTKALSCPWFSDSQLGEGIAPLWTT